MKGMTLNRVLKGSKNEVTSLNIERIIEHSCKLANAEACVDFSTLLQHHFSAEIK